MDELGKRRAEQAIAAAERAVADWEALAPEAKRGTGDLGALLRRRITEARWLVRLEDFNGAIRLVNVDRAKAEAAWLS